MATDLAGQVADLGGWQRLWAARIARVRRGEGLLSISEASAGLRQGSQLLLGEGGLVAQRLASWEQQPEHAAEAKELMEALRTLHQLVGGLPGRPVPRLEFHLHHLIQD